LSRRVESSADVRAVCSEGIPAWRGVPQDELEVKELSGGITNSMYCCGRRGDESFKVVVRVFGSEGVIDRGRENRIYERLSANEVAPEFLVEFGNGRVEQFFPYRTLKREDLRKPVVFRSVARELAKLHQVEISLDKDEHGLSDAHDIWTCMDKWCKEASNIKFPGRVPMQVDEFRREIADLKHEVQRRGLGTPVVFCHNDLLAANVLFDDSTARVRFIDFEYGGLNPRGFDIGNHLSEWMGGTEVGIVYFEDYPSVADQRGFCRCYLEEYLERAPGEDEVAALVFEADLYSLVSHLYWSIWAVCQSAASNIDFDYALFAENRLRAYEMYRTRFLSRASVRQ